MKKLRNWQLKSQMTYEEAKKFAIKVSEEHNGDYVYILNSGKRFDIAYGWMEYLMKKQWGYKMIEVIYVCDKDKEEDMNNDGQRNL